MRSPGLKTAVFILGAVLLVENGAFVLARAVHRFRTPASAPVDRGRTIAEGLGCFECHGPDGTRGLPNPGSAAGRVPSWDGGTLMMFARDGGEIREWILEGAPRRLRENPDYRERMGKALVRMPAFRGRVEGRDFEDLVTFFRAVAWADTPDGEAAIRGRSAALEHGCFSCHGPEGRGNARNPGGFKGFIPSWDGAEFSDLVRDEGELRDWILTGGTPRIRENPIAKRFIARQAIAMPAFQGSIEGDDLDAIVSFIRWLRDGKLPAAKR